MFIEFCCTVCKTPLAIETHSVGGQVNCPGCDQQILLPTESPLPRAEEDLPPFHPGQERDVAEIAEAIRLSVAPYRRDLESKTTLLNDAVGMIKTRNERIQEIETLLLSTQRDLWALEAGMEASDRNNAASLNGPGALKKRETTDAGLNITLFQNWIATQLQHQQEHTRAMTEAAEALHNARLAVERLCAERDAQEQQRLDMEELAKASSQDMEDALDDRRQWREYAQGLEKKLERLTLRSTETGLADDEPDAPVS